MVVNKARSGSYLFRVAIKNKKVVPTKKTLEKNGQFGKPIALLFLSKMDDLRSLIFLPKNCCK